MPLPIASGHFYALVLRRRDERVRLPLVVIDGCPATAAVLARGRRNRPRSASMHAASGPSSALALVRAGAACAVIAAPDAPRDDKTVRWYPMPDVPGSSVGIAWHLDRDTCPMVLALGAAARQAFARPPQP